LDFKIGFFLIDLQGYIIVLDGKKMKGEQMRKLKIKEIEYLILLKIIFELIQGTSISCG